MIPGRRPGGHLRGSQAAILSSRQAATSHPSAGQAQICVCECPVPEGPPRPDTDEKAPLAHHWGPAGAPRSGRHCRRRRHCQSKELIPCTMSSDGKHLEISVKAFLPLSQIPPFNNDNGLTSLLLRYMVFIQNKRELHISSAITWPGWVRYYSVQWMKDRIVWVLNLLHWDIAYLAILNELWSISLRLGDHGRVQTEPLIMNKTYIMQYTNKMVDIITGVRYHCPLCRQM